MTGTLAGYEVTIPELHEAYAAWCKASGRESESMQGFARDLKGAFPQLAAGRARGAAGRPLFVDAPLLPAPDLPPPPPDVAPPGPAPMPAPVSADLTQRQAMCSGAALLPLAIAGRWAVPPSAPPPGRHCSPTSLWQI